MDIPMKMTKAQKHDLLERIETLSKIDVLTREDRDDIYRICLAACSRALARWKEERECS